MLDPREVGRRLRPPACLLLAVPRFVAYATAARWYEVAGAELVEPEDLETRVVQAASVPLREPLPLVAWAPAPVRLDALAARILLAVPHLEDLSAAGLATALEMRARRLRRTCDSRFGKSPVDLLWAYKREYFLRRRRDGARCAEIAFDLGYANKSNLLRALRGHGVALPSEAPGRDREVSEGDTAASGKDTRRCRGTRGMLLDGSGSEEVDEHGDRSRKRRAGAG